MFYLNHTTINYLQVNYCEWFEKIANDSSYSAYIQTIEGGPVVGAYCRFPFRYKDVEYNMCTSVDHQLTPDAIEAGQEEEGWCATKVDAHGDYIPHHWGLCQPECKPPKSMNF